MAKIEVSFVDLHNPLFMNGSNLGQKINLKQRGAVAHYDTDLSCLILQFKGKVAIVPSSNVASLDVLRPEELGLEGSSPSETTLPPAQARAKREQAIIQEAQAFDPEDKSPEAHRARVRAASANANRPDSQRVQTDDLIQQARMAAMGLKHQQTAQVQTAQQVGELASVSGKKKAINHAQLRAQVAAEMKDPNA